MNRKTLIATVSAAALSLGATAAMAQTITLNGGGSTLAQPTYQTEFDTYTNNNPAVLFSYDGVGSGGGQTAVQTNAISAFNNPATQYGTIVGSTVAFGASDALLSSSQLSAYNSGRGVTDGALIQIPMIGVPITIPFENTSQGTVVLRLTDDKLCGVLSGQITSWKQISGQSKAGTITVIYRSDGSGTTFLLTQHLNAVCNASNSSFATLPVPITKTFASLFTNSTPPGNFIGESGSSAVATELLATPLSLGYLSPDYTAIAPNSPNTTSLKTADLTNATNNVSYAPTVTATKAGLSNPGPGSTNPTPPATQANAANPLNWVPAIPVTNTGYPIVGYTTLEMPTCFSSATTGSDLKAFLKYHFSSATATILNNNGFVPLSNTAASKYVTAVTNTFLSNVTGYNLAIDNTTACKGFPGR